MKQVLLKKQVIIFVISICNWISYCTFDIELTQTIVHVVFNLVFGSAFYEHKQLPYVHSTFLSSVESLPGNLCLK